MNTNLALGKLARRLSNAEDYVIEVPPVQHDDSQLILWTVVSMLLVISIALFWVIIAVRS